MSIGAAVTPPRVVVETLQPQGILAAPAAPVPDDASPVAGLDAVDGEPAAPGLPTVLRDAQGREFRLQQDPVSGAPQYRHASAQRDQAGSSLELEILITLAPDGSFTRRSSQHLQMATGDNQREVVTGSFAADGTQLAETVESSSAEGTATTSERTVGTYAGGKLVRRETDVEQRDEATDPKTGERTVIGTKVHGTWDEGGAPITPKTIPHVTRDETQQITSPKQGLHTDHDRVLTFTRSAHGPVDALDWDEHGTLVVRFNGRKGQYVEREMRVPLDQATGAPQMNKAETIRTDDRQDLVNKALMQTRIWGGLASNVSWIIGLNFARGSLGKGFLAFSAASAGAQLVGETHAVATKRADGDWGRVAVSAYDMLLTGLLAAYVTRRTDARSQLGPAQRMGLTALGGAGLAINGAELLGASNPVGTNALTARLRDSGIGAQLAAPAAPTALDGEWRAEPRFDAARALLS